MNEKDYFLKPTSISHKQYEALRAFFIDNLSAKETAKRFGYTYRAFTSLVAAFRKKRKEYPDKEIFFQIKKAGRKDREGKDIIVQVIVGLRKKNNSVQDIKVILDGKKINISEKEIYLILRKEGFIRLHRRTKKEKLSTESLKIKP